MRRTGVLVVGVLSVVWDVLALILAVHRHATFFALAFDVLAVASAAIMMRAQ